MQGLILNLFIESRLGSYCHSDFRLLKYKYTKDIMYENGKDLKRRRKHNVISVLIFSSYVTVGC